MHSDYVFKRSRSSAVNVNRTPATDMEDLPLRQVKPRKAKVKRERKPTIYEQSFGVKLKALVTGKAPKKLTKKKGRTKR
jgi:hypothetical protein